MFSVAISSGLQAAGRAFRRVVVSGEANPAAGPLPRRDSPRGGQRSRVPTSVGALLFFGAALSVQAAPALPEAATLTYELKAKASGFNVDVDSTLRWQPDGERYTLTNEGRFLFFSFLWVSEGSIQQGALQPQLYREKRNKREKLTRFDAQAKRIHYYGGQQEAWRPGIQDRLSVLLTLSALGKEQPSRFKPGATVSMPVTGSSRSDNWHFTVQDLPVLDTALGPIKTVRLRRSRDDDDGQKIEVWLAPDQDWLPVRVLSKEPDGDYLDQTIKAITRP